MSEKIYCIQCGREIKEGLLYCDRCGQSVAKSKQQQTKNKTNRRQAEELHREQINRRKRREEKEIKKQIKRRKARKRAIIMGITAAILILGVFSAAGAYIYMTKNSSIKSVDDVVNEDITQASPEVTSGQTIVSSASTDAGIGFRTFEHNGLSCPYPENFMQKTSVSGLMHLEDPAGGAVMKISAENVSGLPSDMMTAYYDSASGLGKVTENRSGADWYIVTYETDSLICHRKCIISGNNALCYDFQYDKASAKASEYGDIITSLDETFNVSQDNQ